MGGEVVGLADQRPVRADGEQVVVEQPVERVDVARALGGLELALRGQDLGLGHTRKLARGATGQPPRQRHG